MQQFQRKKLNDIVVNNWKKIFKIPKLLTEVV